MINKRIVLKIGTSTLTQGSSRISRGKIEDIANQIQHLTDTGYQIVLVSSGAIAAARQVVKMRNSGSIKVKQALASIGQLQLMKIYQEVFSDYDIPVSQCLLTYYDFKNQDSKENIINTIEALLKFNFLPIINENDTVATDEIMFGDNDKLAALTAVLCKAELLVLATDIDGLYDSDPKSNPDAQLIREVKDLKDYIDKVGESKSDQGSGGMKSKLVAAQIAQEASIPTWILNGGQPNFLIKALNQESNFTKVII